MENVYDDLMDLDEMPATELPATKPAPTEGDYLADNGGRAKAITEGQFTEPCKKCRGTGKFQSWSGRQVGPCFACKGKGSRTYKTSPEQRAAQKARAKAAKGAKANRAIIAAGEFLEANPDIQEWMRTSTWDFALSLRDNLFKYGSLSEKQIAVARKSIAGEAERAQARAAREATEETGLDLTHVPDGMYAVPGEEGETRLKLRIRQPRKGKWAGWVFVDDGAGYGSAQRYGSQKPDHSYRGKALQALTAIAADPKAASAAYGKLTSSCGVCGRLLEDEESVARGIGPICAKKF